MIVNYCKECGQKRLTPKDALSVIMTGYCNSCYDYLNSDEFIARSENVTNEIGIWETVNIEKIAL